MDRLLAFENFVTVARVGSISGAADQLHLAKSAVSKRLTDLEAHLGVQLIQRTTRRLRLTEAGEAFLLHAERILDDVSEAESSLKNQSDALTGRLRIAAPLSFGLSHLQGVIAQFIRHHPRLNVEVDFSDRRVDLVEEGFDMAIRIGVLTDSSLIARKIKQIEHHVVASPAFWDRHGRPTHPDDLNRLEALRYMNLQRPDQIPWWGPADQSGIVHPKIRMLASNGEFLAQMAADHCGFIVEPDFIVEPMVKTGALERVLTEYAWSMMNLYLVFPPTRRISARVRALSDAVVGAFEKK